MIFWSKWTEEDEEEGEEESRTLFNFVGPCIKHLLLLPILLNLLSPSGSSSCRTEEEDASFPTDFLLMNSWGKLRGIGR